MTFYSFYDNILSVMAHRHEAPKQKIPELHFKPEGFISSGSDEFLDQFLETLRARGLDSETLVFSGFDGSRVSQGEPIPNHPFIYAMDEPGWRASIKGLIENPATYAEGWEVPCIGVYDKSQLALVYSSDMTQDLDDLNGRIQLSNIQVGYKLDELPAGVKVEEAVVHKDYPNGSPSDALLGLVFLDEE